MDNYTDVHSHISILKLLYLIHLRMLLGYLIPLLSTWLLLSRAHECFKTQQGTSAHSAANCEPHIWNFNPRNVKCRCFL